MKIEYSWNLTMKKHSSSLEPLYLLKQFLLLKWMKHRLIILIIQFLMSGIGLAQSTRGVVQESDENINIQKGNTYALVIGISDYMGVQPLQFADQDALLFYQFLQSNAGGDVPPQNIKLLINEEATAGSIMTRGISWLQNTVQPKPGDRVYFYFAGHGDAVDASEAYLLAYDAQPGGDKNNYSVSGTINIQILKNRIRKFTQSGVEVIFIVDACRTADIPGGIEGLRGNYQSIMENPSGDIMLLSASPNEVSFEDNTFGNGHGLFTWELINGLAGAADQDQDQNISLFEIETYVKSKVRNASKKLGGLQNPVICCSHQTEIIISKEDKKWLQEIQQELPQGADEFAAQLAQARGGNDLFSFINDEVKKAYFDIKKYCNLQSEIGFEVADSIYNHVASKYKKEDIEFISQYYCGELINQCQKALNREISFEKNTFDFDECNFFHIHYDYLRKCTSIIGEENLTSSFKLMRTLIKGLRLKDAKAEVHSKIKDGKKTIYYKWDDKKIIANSDTAFYYIYKSTLSSINEKKTSALAYVIASDILMRRRQATGDNSWNDTIKAYLTKSLILTPNWYYPYRKLKFTMLQLGDTIRAENYALIEFNHSLDPYKYLEIAKFYNSTNEPLRNKSMTFLLQGLNLATSESIQLKYYWALYRHYRDFDNCDSTYYYTIKISDISQRPPSEIVYQELLGCCLMTKNNKFENILQKYKSDYFSLENYPLIGYLIFFSETSTNKKNKIDENEIMSMLNDSTKAVCYQRIADKFRCINDLKNSKKYLLKANQIDPNNKFIAFDIYKLYLDAFDTLQAITALKNLIDLDSTNARHLIELAFLEIQLNEISESFITIQKAEKLTHNPNHFMAIAEVYSKLNMPEKVNLNLERAIQLGYNKNLDDYERNIWGGEIISITGINQCRIKF